jgi:hypothetical protein
VLQRIVHSGDTLPGELQSFGPFSVGLSVVGNRIVFQGEDGFIYDSTIAGTPRVILGKDSPLQDWVDISEPTQDGTTITFTATESRGPLVASTEFNGQLNVVASGLTAMPPSQSLFGSLSYSWQSEGTAAFQGQGNELDITFTSITRDNGVIARRSGSPTSELPLPNVFPTGQFRDLWIRSIIAKQVCVYWRNGNFRSGVR